MNFGVDEWITEVTRPLDKCLKILSKTPRRGGIWLHGGSAGITLEVLGVVVALLDVSGSGMGTSASAVGLLDLESKDFNKFTSPPELVATRSLISGATLNNVDKFFFLLQTCQIVIVRAAKRVNPITIWTVKIELGGMDRG